MAGWAYSDYVTLDYGAARLTRLRLHVQEVADRLEAFQTGGYAGQTGARFQVETYLSKIRAEMRELEANLGVGIGSVSQDEIFVEVHPKIL